MCFLLVSEARTGLPCVLYNMPPDAPPAFPSLERLRCSNSSSRAYICKISRYALSCFRIGKPNCLQKTIFSFNVMLSGVN